MMRLLATCALLAPLAACGSDDAADPGAPAETPEELVRLLRAEVAELAARPEHEAETVRVRHVLVGVAGGGVEGVTRTPAEAELLAAEVLGRARAGQDFGLLIKNHSDDPNLTGEYVLVLGSESTGEALARAQMMPAFGDVAWRLAVGEVGVAPHDAERSPLGYHVIERLE